MHSPVAGFVQPQIADCWKPKTLSATPDAISARPRKSMRAGSIVGTRLGDGDQGQAMIATGMLTQKIARQVHWVS